MATMVAVEPEEPEEPQRNECVSGEANCDDNADCTDMEAGFSCACREGFEGDGTSCSGMPIRETSPLISGEAV